MSLRRLLAPTLVVLVSFPGFLLGQKLRHGEPWTALALMPLLVAVVFLAGAIMRQSE